jgi:hypothetical protein
MSSFGKPHTLVICSGQLLASKIHSTFNLRNKIIGEKKYGRPNFYIPTRGKIARPYTSPKLAQTLLSGWLWVPPLYTMNGEYRLLVTYELIWFEKDPIILEEFMEYT